MWEAKFGWFQHKPVDMSGLNTKWLKYNWFLETNTKLCLKIFK